MPENISKKTLIDLEFSTVLQQVAEFSISEIGKKEILEITPFTNRKKVLNELAYTNEYFCSFENENRIPNHRFDNIYEQIKRLAIENSFLEPDISASIYLDCSSLSSPGSFLLTSLIGCLESIATPL